MLIEMCFFSFLIDYPIHSILQILIDTDHFVMYGHIPDTLTLCMKSVSKKKTLHLKHELEHRLKAFDWPIGWSPFAAGFNILRTTNSNHSMESFRKLGTVCVHIFNGKSRVVIHHLDSTSSIFDI
jgi:hypothetical protein